MSFMLYFMSAINQKIASSIPGQQNYIVSLGKALYPTCLGENTSL